MHFLLVLVFSLVAAQASALSCLPTDPVRTYKELDAAPERWGAVVGRLDFDEGRLPIVDWNRQMDTPPETRLRAQFVGHSLGPNGWKTPFQGNVTLVVQCFGPWCAAPQSGQRYLAFVKLAGGKRLVFDDPCGARMFPNPQRSVLKELHTCFVGGPCNPRSLPFPARP